MEHRVIQFVFYSMLSAPCPMLTCPYYIPTEVGIVRSGGKNLVLLFCFFYCRSLAMSRIYRSVVRQVK